MRASVIVISTPAAERIISDCLREAQRGPLAVPRMIHAHNIELLHEHLRRMVDPESVIRAQRTILHLQEQMADAPQRRCVA